MVLTGASAGVGRAAARAFGDSVSVTVDVIEDTGFFSEYHPDQMTGTLSVS